MNTKPLMGDELPVGTPLSNHTVVGWVGGAEVFHLVIKDCPFDYRKARYEFEERFLRAALLRTGSNITKAARMMGISRRYLTMLLAEHSIRARSGTTEA
jgi:DNA-binding NtrC family response regulator